MAKTREEIAKEIMKECKADGEEVTLAEALEMADMELGAKKIKNYTQSAVEKKPKSKKEVKLDDVKVAFLAELAEILNHKVNDLKIANPQKEITFTIGKDSYSLNLVKHRPKK